MRHLTLEADLAVIRSEHQILHDTLREVMAHESCDHDPDPAGCAFCGARAVLEHCQPTREGEPVTVLAALYEVRAGLYAARILDARGHGAHALTPTDGGGYHAGRGSVRADGGADRAGGGGADAPALPAARLGDGRVA